MTLRRRQFLQLTAGAATLPLVPRLAAAQAYPARPMHLIIGFTPGAASDVIGRIFAKNAEPVLGQQFVVENKPGAGSSIAAQYVVRAAADGYTLFIPALSTLTYQIANPDVTFDMRKDFAPVAPLARGTFVLAVNPELKVKSVAELIALAKAKPGQLLFGSVGNGSLPHLCAEMFAQRAGVKLDPRAVSRQPAGDPGPDRRPHQPDLQHRLVGARPDRGETAHCARASARTSVPRCCPTCRPWRKPVCPISTPACGLGSLRRPGRQSR